MVVVSAVGDVLRTRRGRGARREPTGELLGDVGGVGVVRLGLCRRWPGLAKFAAATAFLAPISAFLASSSARGIELEPSNCHSFGPQFGFGIVDVHPFCPQFVFGRCCCNLKPNQLLCCVGCVRRDYSPTIGDVLRVCSTSCGGSGT